MNSTEGQNLIKVLNEMGVKPKTDSKEDLKAWMVDYGKQEAVEGYSASTSLVFPQQTKMVTISSVAHMYGVWYSIGPNFCLSYCSVLYISPRLSDQVSV